MDVNLMKSRAFRDAWGNFATGVSLVTTVEKDGSVHGMTANGIASISLDPMLVMVCVSHSANSYPILKAEGLYGINILSVDQVEVAEYYAKPTEKRIGDLDVKFTRTIGGVPLLQGALSVMACKVIKEHVAGDHSIFIGLVESIDTKDGDPLLFFRGNWTCLESH